MNDDAHERVGALELQNEALRARLTQQDPTPLALGLSPREVRLVEGERLAPVGSWTWDLNSGEIRWSKELYRILGYDPHVVTPSSEAFFGAIHPEDRERVHQGAERALTGDNTEIVEFRVIRPDGNVRHVHLEGAGLLGPHGEKTHLVGAILDLTEAKRSASLLLHTIEELRTAQRLALMGSYGLDLSTMQVTWSLGMYELFGVDLGEAPSIDLFFEQVHPEDRPRARQAMEKLVTTRKSVSLELRMQRRDGTVWHAIADSVPQQNENGEWMLRGIVQDISRRKAEEERLRHAEKMAAVGTLAGGIAHDFNNCLTVLVGEADLLRLTLPPEHRGTRSLNAIVAAADRCTKLTSQLLTFGRKRQAAAESIELGELVQRLTAMFRSVLGERNEVSVRTDGTSMFVRADPIELEHALMNLAVNARDAQPKGGQCVLSVEQVIMDRPICGPGGHTLALISVSDTGVGIEPEMLPRVFEPFFTTEGIGRSSGLGLATVYSVVQRAGGHVEVVSDVGRGTTFRLYLPLVEAPQREATVQPPEEPQRLTKSKTVLVVEDLPELRSLISDQLVTAGYRVELAEHGRAALDVLARRGESIDCVLSDVVMPVMGGFELEEAVRTRYPHIRCALMTGYAERESEPGHARIALRKPFSRKELLVALNALFRTESATHPRAEAGPAASSRALR